MALLDKLMFWKKKDDLSDLGLGDLGKDMDADFGKGPGLPPETPGQLGMPDLGTKPSQPGMHDFGASPKPSPVQQDMPDLGTSPPMDQPFGSPMQPSVPQAFSRPAEAPRHMAPSKSHDMELVSAKLDAIRVYLDTISQRLENLERMIRGQSGRNW